MASSDLPLRAIREQIASAFDLIVYMERIDDGSRKVTFITEVHGFEQDTILLQHIFHLDWIERGGQRVNELTPDRHPPPGDEEAGTRAHLPGARLLRAAPGHHRRRTRPRAARRGTRGKEGRRAIWHPGRLLLFAAIFGIVGGGAATRRGAGAREHRVRSSSSPRRTAPTAGRRRRGAEDRAFRLFEQLDERWHRASPPGAEDEIERADLQLTVSEFTLLRAGAAVLLIFCSSRSGPSLWWALLVPGLLIGWWLPRCYLRWAAGRRLRRLDDQLPDILDILAGSVRTGSSLFQALDRIAREAAEPSRTEYLRVVRAISLGAPLETALGNLPSACPPKTSTC